MDQGQAIKRLRERPGRKWTQQELADHLGVDRFAIIDWEKNRKAPTATQRKSLAKAFRVPLKKINQLATQYPDPIAAPKAVA